MSAKEEDDGKAVPTGSHARLETGGSMRGSPVFSSLKESLRTRSAVFSDAVRQRQLKAELKAKTLALEKRRQLELEKLNLKLKEEKHELETAIAVLDARNEVVDMMVEEELAGDSNIPSDICGVYDRDRVSQQRCRDYINSLANSVQDGCDAFSEKKKKKKCSVNDKVSALPVHQSASELHQEICHGSEDSVGQESIELMCKMLREFKKPNVEIQKFQGNVMDYKRFMRQFNSKIVANTDSFDEMMNFLIQYTSGEAQRVVIGYSNLEASVGYPAALQELERRYGDPEVIAHSFVQKALNWEDKELETVKGLDEFSIFLMECHYAVKSLDAVKILDYPDNIQKIVSKLPYNYHDKWRTEVYKAKGAKRPITFAHMVAFVRAECTKVSDPYYGKDAMYKAKGKTSSSKASTSVYKKGGSGSVRTKSSFGTDATEMGSKTTRVDENSNPKPGLASLKPCVYCQGCDHCMNVCKSLSSVDLKSRYDFLKSKGLCFACLKSGHQRKDCKHKVTCS
ncbi:MAG: DUF1759 domain-containing protein, partial [Candidatus Omnitrophica bacterium]|nr:DUF1759 domain-containing protein [Candidatus Omnitrophota bacterium]